MEESTEDSEGFIPSVSMGSGIDMADRTGGP